jgi:hypothetical protein
MMASVASRTGDADTALRLYKELADEGGPGSKMHSSAAMSSLYSDRLSAQEVADLHRDLFKHLGDHARQVSSFKNKPDLQRPLTFGSFNNVPKLTPHTLRLWAQVLQQVPGSRLLLKAPSFKELGAIEVFTQRFAALGILAERLEFRGPVGLTDMMAEYANVDIALDTLPYNGGTTSLQALWMGCRWSSRRAAVLSRAWGSVS